MKLHLPKLLLTAVLTACSAAQAYAASPAPTDAATSTIGDLLWAYSSSTEGKYTNNLPEGASITGSFIENEDGSITAKDGNYVYINGLTSGSSAGFTVSFDLLATDTGNWRNVIAVSTSGGEAQLQKSSDGRLMVYANSFGGGSTSGEYSMGQLSSMVGSNITLTFDGSTLSGYVDGFRVTSLTYTFEENATKSAGLTNVTFANNSTNGRWGNSTYDNVGVWNSAMTVEEVAAQAGCYTLNLSGTVDSVNADLQHAHQNAAFSDMNSSSSLAIFGTEGGGTLKLSEALSVKTLGIYGNATIQGEAVNTTSLLVTEGAELTAGADTTTSTLTMAEDSKLTVAGGATLTTNALNLNSTAGITVQKEGMLDLSAISLPDDASSALSKGITGLINQTSGEGTVKLADSSVINTAGSKVRLTFDTNYVIGSDADDSFILNSWHDHGSWITHKVTADGSITVGNGAGTLEFKSGQKLLIEGGSVTVGKLSIGHESDYQAYSGAVEMTSGQLTTGTIYAQNKGADDWKNEIKLTGGTLKITGDTALTYATTARTTAIIGGSGANTLILQTGDKNWSMSKGSTAGNTLEIGNITIDAANTKMITINDAQLSGTIVNNATAEGAGLTLSGNFTLSDSLTQEQVQYTHCYSENGFTENIDITLNIFSGDGNYTFSENMTVEGITFSDFTRSGSSYTYSSTRIGTIYHVVNAPFTIDGSDTNAAKDATGYHVHAGQTLTVAANQSDSMTAARIMATTTGDGIINLTTTAAVTENTPLVFDGVLKVSAGGDLSVSGANAITAEKLDVAGGKVTATLNTGSDQSVIGHGTEVNIGTGGTLVLAGHDMVGWGKNTAPSIILGSDDATKKAVLDIQDTGSCTFGAPLTMNGNSEVKGTKINNFGSSLTVTNTGNTISISEIQIRYNKDIPSSFAIDVAKGGELTISSKLTNHSDGTIDINKSGLGKLVVTNSESTWTGTLNVTAGILELREAATLNSVVMSANTSLISGNGKIKSLTLESGSELQAASAVTMADESSLSLGIGLTLNGDLLNSIKSLTGDKTVDLFTNVGTLTLGEDVFTKGTDVLDATSGIDLSKYFNLAGAQTPAVLSDEQLSSGYYLGFDANGTLYAGLIPEPTTATLSLLALAGLAARRRRK